MEELPSFGCRWCCKAALCVFFYPLPLFVAFTPEYILPSFVGQVLGVLIIPIRLRFNSVHPLVE